MIIKNFSEIDSNIKNLAIIINVNTKIVTTLCLLSALKYIKYPILLIDCNSKDKSFDFFSSLLKSFDFYLISLPLKKHGHMLDFIFKHIHAENVLLIDSDIELLDDKLFNIMHSNINSDKFGGCGFIHKGEWLDDKSLAPYAWYVERMWIPFVALKTNVIKNALNVGGSFIHKKIANDFPISKFISTILMYRYRVPFFKNLQLNFFKKYRKEFFGQKPSFLYYDTGALIYQYLFTKKYLFYGISWDLTVTNLIHFHGITRNQLHLFDSNSTGIKTVEDYVLKRLNDKYDINKFG